MGPKIGEVMIPAPVAVPVVTPVARAAEMMRGRGIGGVLVIDDGQLRGLVTDRDIVVRAVAAGLDVATAPVAGICSEQLVTVTPQEDASAAVRLMRRHAARRILVVDNGHPVGVVTLGDMAVEDDPGSALADISARPPNG